LDFEFGLSENVGPIYENMSCIFFQSLILVYTYVKFEKGIQEALHAGAEGEGGSSPP
jgi:hypothetical protein